MSGPVPGTREHPPPCSRKDKVAFFYNDWIISSIPVFSLTCSPLVKPNFEYLGTEMDVWPGFDHLVVECGVNGLMFSHGYLNHSNPNLTVGILRGKYHAFPPPPTSNTIDTGAKTKGTQDVSFIAWLKDISFISVAKRAGSNDTCPVSPRD